MRLFENRLTAAVELSRHLDYLRPDSPIVLGLDNGGVQVAEIVADALGAPLDVLLLARLRAPEPPHRVVGVVDEFGRVSMIESTARWHHLSSQQMIGPAREAFRDLRRKRGKVRAIIPSLEVENRTVIVVDEGVGTGRGCWERWRRFGIAERNGSSWRRRPAPTPRRGSSRSWRTTW